MAIENLNPGVGFGTHAFNQQAALFLKVEQGFEKFGGELHAGMGEFLALKVQELTPVKTGRLRGSWNLSSPELAMIEIGALGAFPVPGLDVWSGALDSMRKLHPGFITNAARMPGKAVSYAGVINIGQHVDSLGRPAGSPQAADGIAFPALQQLDAALPRLADAAAARAGLA